MKKVAFHTLGCKLNFSETSTLARSFEQNDFTRVNFDAVADFYVINTCSVTNNADKECRSIVRKVLRTNPSAFVAITGCYAQLKPQEVSAIPGVDLVLGANEKFDLAKYLTDSTKLFTPKIFADEIKHCNSFIPSFSSGDRTRTFLKVQDGCDYFCSFCTIPLARGRSRSNTVEETIRSAKLAILEGAKEIVLTGVNIGDFGHTAESKDTHQKETFLDLIRELDLLEGVERFRISSIEPNLLTDDIIDFVSSSNKFVPHFHIPLQSGSDVILSNMRRRYNTSLYSERIERIQARIPNCCIGADVITGFPGETETEFNETLEFIQSLSLSYLHVFTYSERPDTTAVRMKNAVPLRDRQHRTGVLKLLSDKMKQAFYLSQAGKTVNVLFEAEEDKGLMKGFSENYIRVSAPYDSSRVNTISPVLLVRPDERGEYTCMTDPLPIEAHLI